MNTLYQSLLEALKTEIHQNTFLVNPRERFNAAMRIIDEAMVNLNTMLSNQQLSEEEEISVFKKIKPEIESYKIEEGLRYNIHKNLPIATIDARISYYQDEIRAVQIMNRRNSFYYHYYKEGFTELDRLYFLRGTQSPHVVIPEIPEIDPDYLTPVGYLFAKFMAGERIQYALLQSINRLNGSLSEGRSLSDGEVPEMNWTGDVINLVELAYGILLTGQLNNGNAKLDHLVLWLEKNLNVKIGKIRNRFAEVARRKRLSKTRFLDEMITAVLKKMDEANE